MKPFIRCLVLPYLLFLLSAVHPSPALAQTAPDPAPGVLQIATMPMEPFVIVQDDGSLTGFSVDLWDALAQDLGLQYEWSLFNTPARQLEAVRSGQADVAISGIGMTPEREQIIDFSHPYFDTGLRIMTGVQQDMSFMDILQAIFSPTLLKALGIGLLSLIVMAHVIWLIERSSKREMPKTYLAGIWEALWWSFSTISSFEYGDRVKPNAVWKRLVAMFLVLCSIILIAQFTASITTSMTVQQLTGVIEGPDDLPGARIATVEGSTAAQYLDEEGLEYTSVEMIEDAYQLLKSGDVDAVVFDSAVLIYYAAHQGAGQVEIVGQIFQDESYAIVLVVDSALREPLNEALLRLRQNGTYDQIYEKWFGDLE